MSAFFVYKIESQLYMQEGQNRTCTTSTYTFNYQPQLLHNSQPFEPRSHNLLLVLMQIYSLLKSSYLELLHYSRICFDHKNATLTNTPSRQTGAALACQPSYYSIYKHTTCPKQMFHPCAAQNDKTMCLRARARDDEFSESGSKIRNITLLSVRIYKYI